MRHSLTVGEYLIYAKDYYKIDIELDIIKIENWKRELYEPLWTYPSPNMPSYNTVLAYPGAVMLEGTNLSEGRGTTRPFEFVGAPFLNAIQMVNHMNTLNLNGVRFIPIFFKPEFSKFANMICDGIYIYVIDVENFRSFEVYYEIIRFAYHMYPDKFEWKNPPYEYEYKRLPIDMISASVFIRENIENNISYSEIREDIDNNGNKYLNSVKPFLLY
jgi:uncharacterized protein YbbC (DUF1343 family)